MAAVQGRARYIESIVGVCILAVLFIIAGGLLLKQSRFQIGDSDIKPVVDTSQSQKNEINLINFLPVGFKPLSEIELYNAENLYEKINGKAPLYTESGFRKLLTQRFVSKNDPNQVMELYLYDMAAPENAFSVYSTQRRANAIIDSLFPSSFGYKTRNAFYFIRGKYYIELVGFTESAALIKAIKETAQKIDTQLPADKSGEITELNLFPQENFVQGSIKLYLTNAFGTESLNRTFTAQYKIGNQTLTAFLSKRADSKDAAAIAQSYRKFLIDNGLNAKKAINQTLDGAVFDFDGTTEIVTTAGNFIIGIHEADDQNSAEKLAIELIGKPSKETNNGPAK